MKVVVEEINYNQGYNPVAIEIKNDKESVELDSFVKVNAFTYNSNKTVVAAQMNNVLYFGESNAEKIPCNNFLVIRNKKTNKVRLVSYDTVSMDCFATKENSSSVKTVLPSKGTSADLTKEFGSKRAIRVTEQREKMKLDIENARETLQKTVDGIKNHDESILNNSQYDTSETDTSYLPPINRNASVVEQVYELKKLIPPNVMDDLQSDVDTVLACDELSELPLSHFCMQNIKILKGNDEIASDNTRCKIYLYLNYLLKFLTTPVRSMNKKYVLCNSSTVVNFYILDNFSTTTKNTRTRSSFMRDKIICYILVLAAIASPNKQVDLEVLSQDTKLGIKKLQEISRMLAFTPIGPKKVCLKIPLPAPMSAFGKKKKY